MTANYKSHSAIPWSSSLLALLALPRDSRDIRALGAKANQHGDATSLVV